MQETDRFAACNCTTGLENDFYRCAKSGPRLNENVPNKRVRVPHGRGDGGVTVTLQSECGVCCTAVVELVDYSNKRVFKLFQTCTVPHLTLDHKPVTRVDQKIHLYII